MRTTVDLDRHLLAEVKQLAARTGKTLSVLVEEALRESLARRQAARASGPAEFPTFRGEGLRPGVDLDHSGDLLEVMEASDADA
jgi:hypothetical protein